MIRICSRFDGGNIQVVDAADPADIRLKIRRDAGGNVKGHLWVAAPQTRIG